MKRSHRHVAVILNEDVEGTGFAGQLVSVQPGFARNFLLSKGLAVSATPKARAAREKEIAKAEERVGTETAAREELAAKLAEIPVELSLKVGPGGQVFGAITAADLAASVKSQRKLDVDLKQLSGLPLAALGPAQVSVKLGLGVAAQIPVVVKGEQAKTAATAKKAAKAEKQEPAKA